MLWLELGASFFFGVSFGIVLISLFAAKRNDDEES